jgi:formylglycine-generating enzyme required for sulfatase activity
LEVAVKSWLFCIGIAFFAIGCASQGTGLYDFDADGSLDADDCAPSDPLIHPGADDPHGDGIDQNCDGGDGIDLDGDGYPSNLDLGDPLLDCNDSDATLSPADQDSDGYSSCAGDCNDLDASVTPNDGDLDGYSSCDGDCDDINDLMNPGQVEVCDLIDNDCDSSTGEVGDGIDEDGDGDAACSDCDDGDGRFETLDRDGDGISTCGPDGLPDTSDDDCDDSNVTAYPGAADGYNDAVDTNCDGVDGVDADGDGWSALGGDCDDGNPSIYPGAAELCNGLVENCGGTLPADETDGDGDGYVSCVGWTGTDPAILGDGDCSPLEGGTYPGAPVLCSGVDNNCNGTVEDNFDLDGDGYSPCAGDCDDGDAFSVLAGQASVIQGATFRSVCGGTYEMGCTSGPSSCGSDESPAHFVTLTEGFWLSETEVTQGHWQSLMGANPSHFSVTGSGTDCGLNCPVEQVSWLDSLAFANAMSSAESLSECYSISGNSVTVASSTGSVYDCEGYRLPTEAEWEYAARAGTDLLYAGSNVGGDVAWYSSSMTHPVANRQANAWGFYDMSGNVWEWTWDRYASSYYGSGSNVWTDPEGPASGFDLVIRGGGWYHDAAEARVVNRNSGTPGYRDFGFGFRLARTLP